MSLFETIFVTTATLWFLYFIINHAEVTARVRAALFPALPVWLATLLACPLCVSFWTLAAVSLFVGYTPLLFWCPPCCLMWDAAYRRLSGSSSKTPSSS